MSRLIEPRCIRRHKLTHACLQWEDSPLRGALTCLGKPCPPQLRGAMTGDYCESRITSGKPIVGSYRWKLVKEKRSGQNVWILVGCPKGANHWNRKTKSCRVGMKAYAILRPASSASCPRNQRRIKKG